MRIASLLPSATELVCGIGAGDLLVARSHECDFPVDITRLPALTSPRTRATASADIDRQVRESLGSHESVYVLDEDRLRELQPDVILTQDLCEVCSIDLRTVERIADDMDPRPRIISLNPTCIADVFDDALRIGEVADCAETARDAVTQWRDRMFRARHYVNAYLTGPEVTFIEWVNPIFVGGHWMPELIDLAGAQHSLNPPGQKSRTVTPDEINRAQPEHVIVCPCGTSIEWTQGEIDREFASQDWWKELPAVRGGRVAIVDGRKMFNRPGPRLIDSLEFLIGWLNHVPSLIPETFPWRLTDPK